MMVEWWLRDNPQFKTLEQGGEWLVGFRSRLEKSDLHDLDWDHLEELASWHKDKEKDAEPTGQFMEGSSTQAE